MYTTEVITSQKLYGKRNINNHVIAIRNDYRSIPTKVLTPCHFKDVNFKLFLSFTAGPDLSLGLPQTDLPQQKVYVCMHVHICTHF